MRMFKVKAGTEAVKMEPGAYALKSTTFKADVYFTREELIADAVTEGNEPDLTRYPLTVGCRLVRSGYSLFSAARWYPKLAPETAGFVAVPTNLVEVL